VGEAAIVGDDKYRKDYEDFFNIQIDETKESNQEFL